MSTRSSPGSLTTYYDCMEYPPPGGGLPYYLAGPTKIQLNWIDSVTHGDNVPGFREKLRDGIDATTSQLGVRTTAQLTPGHAVTRYNWGVQKWRIELNGSHNVNVSVPPGDPVNIPTAKANAAALGKFNQSLRNVRTAFEGGVFLGELGQTLRMIKNPAQGLRKLADVTREAAQQIRRGRFPTSIRERKITEALADLWLEAQFGWRPLMNDIKDGSEALNQFAARRDNGTRRITGRGTAAEEATQDISSQHSFGVLRYMTHGRVVGNCSIIYRGAIRVEAKNPLQMDPALIGFDLRSFVPTVWELIPYSFLIDYFSNIGDVITGWSNLGLRLAWSNKTVRTWYERTSWSSDFTPRDPSVTSVTFAPAKFVCSKVRTFRSVYSGTFVPDAQMEVPGLGSLKWANIAALIASRRSDRKWAYD